MPRHLSQQVRPVLPPESQRVTLDLALNPLDAAHELGREDRIVSLPAIPDPDGKRFKRRFPS
jgi:hypothetical protein